MVEGLFKPYEEALYMLKKKTPQESEVIMRQLVMPNDANPQNNVFGGTVMSWIDMAAAMVAERHTGKICVTVHIDDISFKAPINVGEHAIIKARVNYVGRTSLLIGTKVFAENPRTGECRHTTTAYLTFVALDNIGRPTLVPGLELSTEEEARRFEDAKARMAGRPKDKSRP